ncbi:MAG: 16S rRNA (cytosine(967)-C(5))-methyltransferase RsmB [Gammaproteobacteria bacterium]|nr:16S rRNA (cytosine(967)-C(5))-methyltransferase RsmB [Gammaproteobacteria bacterium]MDH4311259.1 16S rRNA (cytosine(967)-C(5))-methyltransferase RsmB [Gammaproteobacteria bacterium]MDH5273471.1 16S rRNA (cytosine(967)-C(5))-methyltransferase RsmB [Gammaproteobacteria bacterium]
MSARTGPAEVRASAAIIVAAVLDEGRSLDDVLAVENDEGSARGLKRSLCYGTLRWHVRLAAVLNALATRSPDQLAPRLRALLEIGLFQLVSGETAAHAAVAETVSAARVLGFDKAAGFVNAILRRFQREQADLLHAIDRDVALRTAHPRWFVDALRTDRGEAAALAALDANNAHPPLWVRVNSMRGDVAWAKGELEAAGFTVTPHPLAHDALQVTPPADVRSLPGFMDGRLSVQDAAAQLAIELLDPQEGDRILDACAAPGGKTCHMLERTNGNADVTALDVSEPRLQRIRDNLERLGLQARIMAADVENVRGWWDGRPYDRVLLDVPCSATGVIRRHPDIKVLRRAKDIPTLARKQANLLAAAWGVVKPGGRLLYTSCSVLAAENERVVAAFLLRTPDALDLTPELTGSWPPRPGGAGPGYQVLPGETGMDGFYYACLGKPL